MRLLFDLDGVLRALDVAVFGRIANSWWETLSNGKNLVNAIDEDPSLLLSAPKTEYFDTILGSGTFLNIVTHQPFGWRDNTHAWIERNVGNCNVSVVDASEEKLRLLERFPCAYLVEDNPNLKNYERIILVDRPYNRCIDAFMRIKTPKQMAWLLSVVRG